MTRIIIYTGKGGVGKTSIASATALASAIKGYKTLLLSTDSAHSTSDSFDTSIGPRPTKIYKNLWAQEIDVITEIEDNWKDLSNYLAMLFSSIGLSDVKSKELAILPGMDFVAALFNINRYIKNNDFDTIIMDTAPTADTLRLLSFPNIAEWYFKRFFYVNKYATKVARATMGKVMKTPLPTDNVFDSFEEIYGYFQSIQNILTDPEITTVRLVVNPEKMVISETQRAFTYLSLYDFTVEAIVINRVMPSNTGNNFFDIKQKEQENNMKIIEESFGDIYKLYAPMYSHEIIGLDYLIKLANDLFKNDDPLKVYSKEKSIHFIETKKNTTISILIPFIDENGVIEAYISHDILHIRVGSYRRSIALPLSMAKSKIKEAKYKNQHLNISFDNGDKK